METVSVSKKVHIIGTWQEDVFSDFLLKKIAAYAQAEKGKKAKVVLSDAGLRITKLKFFQSGLTQWYPFSSLHAVTRNPVVPSCVMFILADPQRKYQIIAAMCATETDASQLASAASQIKKKGQANATNVEFRKRENGNWTLRERSAHNANKHMAELFNRQPSPKTENNHVTQNGNAQKIQPVVPILDASKRNDTALQTPVARDEDNNYVIETEVASGAQPDDVRVLKGQVNSLSHEVNQLKSLLRQSSIRSSMGDPQAQPLVLPERPQIVRAPPKTYEAKLAPAPTQSYSQPWVAGSRRTSAIVAFPFQLRSRAGSMQNSARVQFDNESVVSNSSRKSKSLKIYSSSTAIPTTVQRSIEDTYARPVIFRQSARAAIGRRQRPTSFHAIPANELKLYQPKDISFDDVAL